MGVRDPQIRLHMSSESRFARYDSDSSPRQAAPVERDCPLNNGLAILDQLLAALTQRRRRAELDLALDFRFLLSARGRSVDVLPQWFRLRDSVEEEHYLLAYRLRRWLEKRWVAHVSFDRSSTPRVVGLQLDAPSYDDLCEECICAASDLDLPPPWTQIRFVSADPAELAEA